VTELQTVKHDASPFAWSFLSRPVRARRPPEAALGIGFVITILLSVVLKSPSSVLMKRR
jgi:hypothetical protein